MNRHQSRDRGVSAGTHMHAGSLSSCVCTACSSTPRLVAACPCDTPPEKGRLAVPAPPTPPPAALPPPPASSGGPPDSPHSQLQQKDPDLKSHGLHVNIRRVICVCNLLIQHRTQHQICIKQQRNTSSLFFRFSK